MVESSNRGLIIGIATVTVIIFAGLVWLLVSAPGDAGAPIIHQDENVTFSDERAPSLGAVDAKVLVHLYGDFQCPACRSAEPGIKYAISTYQDRVRFIWKDFPLTQIHPNAQLSANAARCAQAQDRFWDYHEKIYDVQLEWVGLSAQQAQDKFIGYAKDLRLNEEMFGSCLIAREPQAKISADIAEGTRNKVDATPTVFINQRRYFGMSSAQWDEALRAALQRAN
ncbi:hypothetical protein EXS71_00935 [Candidatus Uhrbacteria bacterium]|nr:hypothetical protein [Candidatus Uhrbacteria bacterium]